MKMQTKTAKHIPSAQQVLARQKADHAKPSATTQATAVATPSNPWIEVSDVLSKYVGAPLLKFSKDGAFTVSDTESLPDGCRVVAHVDQVQFGWVKWQDGQRVDRRMGLAAERFVPPLRSALGDTDESQWEVQPDGSRNDPWRFPPCR